MKEYKVIKFSTNMSYTSMESVEKNLNSYAEKGWAIKEVIPTKKVSIEEVACLVILERDK